MLDRTLEAESLLILLEFAGCRWVVRIQGIHQSTITINGFDDPNPYRRRLTERILHCAQESCAWQFSDHVQAGGVF